MFSKDATCNRNWSRKGRLGGVVLSEEDYDKNRTARRIKQSLCQAPVIETGGGADLADSRRGGVQIHDNHSWGSRDDFKKVPPIGRESQQPTRWE